MGSVPYNQDDRMALIRNRPGCKMEGFVKVTTLAACVVLLALFAGCMNKAPTVPMTPTADIHGDSLSFFTSSSDPAGLHVRYVFAWGDGDSTVTGLLRSGDTAWCAHVFDTPGEYRVRARACNERGQQSKWSPECLF